jgi:hypothetical protein
LQVQLGEVDLAYRGKVRIAVPAAQLVPGGVARLGELVQPEPVVGDADSDVGVAGKAQVRDPVSQRRLRRRKVTQYGVDVIFGQVAVAEHHTVACAERQSA